MSKDLAGHVEITRSMQEVYEVEGKYFITEREAQHQKIFVNETRQDVAALTPLLGMLQKDVLFGSLEWRTPPEYMDYYVTSLFYIFGVEGNIIFRHHSSGSSFSVMVTMTVDEDDDYAALDAFTKTPEEAIERLRAWLHRKASDPFLKACRADD